IEDDVEVTRCTRRWSYSRGESRVLPAIGEGKSETINKGECRIRSRADAEEVKAFAAALGDGCNDERARLMNGGHAAGKAAIEYFAGSVGNAVVVGIHKPDQVRPGAVERRPRIGVVDRDEQGSVGESFQGLGIVQAACEGGHTELGRVNAGVAADRERR